eukprot:CAMPEP_0170603796 /NCGR_PEP_ID=MMETSP0224-20130122/19096_1 /TAXON_ID=285029 /ORGANISM="Togula jolla, Strain CCCM 725" /LENGTH=33 /DNA_ID= /DNA_START= /DNA_END= /DNA_ORIENTATION=
MSDMLLGSSPTEIWGDMVLASDGATLALHMLLQ